MKAGVVVIATSLGEVTIAPRPIGSVVARQAPAPTSLQPTSGTRQSPAKDPSETEIDHITPPKLDRAQGASASMITKNAQDGESDTSDRRRIDTAFFRSPNYVGAPTDSIVVGISGSQTAPSITAGAAGLFEKFAKSHAANALAGIAYKYGDRYEDRTTGVFGEAADKVGGFGSFVEGMRGQGTLIDGNAGAAYGVICSAGIDPKSGARNFRLLVGCEGEVDNTIGPDAPTFETFSRDHFAISFVASNGVGSGKRYLADAGFWTNSYSLARFQTGFLCSAAVADTCLAATRDTVARNGIDLSHATLAQATLVAPNNAPIRFADAAGTAKLNVLNVDAANVVQVGTDVSRVNVPAALTARSYGVGSTAGVSCPAGTVNLATMVVTNGIITHC